MQFTEKNKIKRKILLINPPLYFFNGIPHVLDVSVPPLGILYIASYITKYSDSFTPLVMDVAVDNSSLEEIGTNIRKINPFAIGISSMTAQLQGCVELAKFIKNNISNKLKIFLGGPHVSADSGFVNRFGDIFDYAITGEAEKTFLLALNNLLQEKTLSKICVGEPIDALDTIPFPDRQMIDRKRYGRYESMIFSRGCPYSCYYCSRPSISKKVRYRSANNLIDEIRSVYELSGGKIDFQDDTFTLDKRRVLELCAEIKRKNLKLEWRCNTRVDLIDEELLVAMKNAGCRLIHFGIESGNERVRREIVDKGTFTNKDIRNVFKLCKKYKIKIAAYFMIGHYGETKEDLDDTREMILNSSIDLLGLSIPTPFPGSRLYDIAKERGIIDENTIDSFAKKEKGEGYAGIYPIFISEKLNKDYLFSFMRNLNRKFYINFRFFFKKLCEDINSIQRIKEDAKDLFSLFFKGVSTRKPYIA